MHQVFKTYAIVDALTFDMELYHILRMEVEVSIKGGYCSQPQRIFWSKWDMGQWCIKRYHRNSSFNYFFFSSNDGCRDETVSWSVRKDHNCGSYGDRSPRKGFNGLELEKDLENQGEFEKQCILVS